MMTSQIQKRKSLPSDTNIFVIIKNIYQKREGIVIGLGTGMAILLNFSIVCYSIYVTYSHLKTVKQHFCAPLEIAFFFQRFDYVVFYFIFSK